MYFSGRNFYNKPLQPDFLWYCSAFGVEIQGEPHYHTDNLRSPGWRVLWVSAADGVNGCPGFSSKKRTNATKKRTDGTLWNKMEEK